MPLYDLSIAPSTRSSVSPSASPFEQPSFGPTIDCSNDLDFRFEGDSLRTCDAYVAFKPVKRCEKIQPGSGGEKVRKFCPGTCKKKCKKQRDEVTSAPSAVPNFDCSDDISFRFEGNPSRTCDSYVAIKPIKRCQKIQPESGGKKVRNFCPSVCKSNCKRRRGPCENLGSFRFEGNSSRTCDSYVAMKPIKRCAKIQPKSGGKKVSEFCPSTCKKKCKKPRGKCEDLITFKFQGNPEFTCDLYVAEKPFKRCKKEVEGTEDENVNSCRGQHASSVVVVLTSVTTVKVDDPISDHSSSNSKTFLSSSSSTTSVHFVIAIHFCEFHLMVWCVHAFLESNAKWAL
ncbi:hypothetical protein FRACYDRAFT_237492 [Fragilariopsis cylindrus CCMP1102]|uniref:Uncharacterized protein n=1 Tax=Fragilariopsis cylindrus CCMP1102 TaxID=635003 RepID=A0A1E7FM15_9STRA|nr:hypothetical protein FRACYDRAFT_237492 [Fragilariopsis cylindrus CCMP1102]|eukprot:OEU19200.1 hypothetical protein FRACYDRAFT_237492 [Fragilariopsis cylindrus CCMP1102]